MIQVKKTALAILVLSSSTAFAGSMASADITTASTAYWDIGIQALYLNPSFNGSFGGQNTTDIETQTSQTIQSTLLPNNPSWQWGFRLEASYHFIKDNDLNLNWYHLRNKKTTDRSSFIKGDETTLYTFSNEPRWDAVNLEFGHQVSFTERNKIRFHGGAQYTQIKNSQTIPDYTDVSRDDDNNIEIRNSTIAHSATFNGFGPRLGADMSYQLGKGFTIFANGAAALLAGTSKSAFTLTGTVTENNTVSMNTASIRYQQTSVISELEGKLGLEYCYPTSHGNLILNAGYLWINYINAIQPFNLAQALRESLESEPDAIREDFSVHGPFLGIKWNGDL
ncbi:Lpg1974 family pore-forming outer membrane protein [Legionella yabuuchiae]|uniref:Lpg1974 family pore-forming outer membrane protein n=1 Tax=Legionella yabuuchiae TaxID=376727 RepID=UPI0010554CB9|nr:Lpg1974 family pore-forming outer membrane protein [Legionella yabuuchiae]